MSFDVCVCVCSVGVNVAKVKLKHKNQRGSHFSSKEYLGLLVKRIILCTILTKQKPVYKLRVESPRAGAEYCL